MTAGNAQGTVLVRDVALSDHAQPFTIEGTLTVADILAAKSISPGSKVVTVNDRIVDVNTTLSPSDEVLIAPRPRNA